MTITTTITQNNNYTGIASNITAKIKVGQAGLKSRFGHTKDLGNGSYEFTATNTASDILE